MIDGVLQDYETLKRDYLTLAAEKETLAAEKEALAGQNEAALEHIRSLLLENRALKERLDLLLRRLYGRRSEKLNPAQLLFFKELFEEAAREVEAEREVQSPEPAEERPEKKRSGKHGRREIPKDLPRKREEIHPPPEERQCPCCRLEMQPIGEDLTEELDFTPAQLFVREIARVKYGCRRCQEGVVTPPLPPRPIERGRPGPGLLAQVAVSKYCDHLPLYRQEEIFARQGLPLSRQTLSDWLERVAWLLEPVVLEMKRRLLASPFLQSDDTHVRVRDPERQGASRRGYLWVYGLPWAEVVYDLTLDHSQGGPAAFLQGFEGHLQCDGYSGYNQVLGRGKVLHVGCWAHVRRKFYDARQDMPREAMAVIAALQQLYRLERRAKSEGMGAEERLKLRRAEAVPILTDLRAVLEALAKSVRPKSPFGRAVSYALDQWPALVRYVDVAAAEIDNNSSEHALRRVVLGRKNWLCLGSAESGGLKATVLYSLVESAKRLGVEPFAYLSDVLERVSTHPASRVGELTPRGWKEAQRERARAVDRAEQPP
jgi:transposase